MAHHHASSLLKTFDAREANAVDYLKNIVFEQAKETAKELFVQPLAPRTYQRRHGQHILDPEGFCSDQVFLPFLRELKANINKRLSIFAHPLIQLLAYSRECITATSCSTTELYKKLTEQLSDHLPQPL